MLKASVENRRHIVAATDIFFINLSNPTQGWIQDFKLGGALKIIAPSGARRENFGVFRVKNHDFTQTNHIFFQF